jgi:hypothetical protein
LAIIVLQEMVTGQEGENIPSSRSGVQTVLLDRSSGGISTSFAGDKSVEYPWKQKAGKFWK